MNAPGLPSARFALADDEPANLRIAEPGGSRVELASSFASSRP
jgi:hypothetical protein